MKEKIKKEKVNSIISKMIMSGGNLNESITKNVTENRFLRFILITWLDAMGVIKVNSGGHTFNKPIWIKTAVKGRYMLYGALTQIEINKLDQLMPSINEPIDLLKIENPYKRDKEEFEQWENEHEEKKLNRYDKNKIELNDALIELPDTYYTSNQQVFDAFDFQKIDSPIFANIESLNGITDIVESLYSKEIDDDDIINYNKIENPEAIDAYYFKLKAEDNERLTVTPQDTVSQFNWRIRNYIDCNLINELNIEPAEESLKLIRVMKKYTHYNKPYTFLLEKAANKSWKYTYFDYEKCDENWARYVFIDRLKFYDIEKDFKGRNDDDKGMVFLNALEAFNSKSNPLIVNSPKSNHFMKIPGIIRKQLVQYDVRQGLLAFPVTMPLPKEIMRYLFSCSGTVPQTFTNHFSENPNYHVKKLYSGISSTVDNNNVPYHGQTYYIKDEFYVFSNVPKELAYDIFSKLGLDIKKDVFKRTFLNKV